MKMNNTAVVREPRRCRYGSG